MKRAYVQMALVVALVLMCTYVLAALIIFDFGQTAYPFDEEQRAGKQVAIGPRPRSWVITPTYHNMFYTGREWPFRLFLPVCYMYRAYKGYESPTQ